MIKYVCDCCGSDSFKEMTELDTILCGVRCVCDDCLETVQKKMESLEENVIQGMTAVAGAGVMEALKVFVAANTAKLFGDGESGIPSEDEVRRIGNAIIHGKSVTGIGISKHAASVLVYDNSAVSMTDMSTKVSKDYINDTVEEYIRKRIKDLP